MQYQVLSIELEDRSSYHNVTKSCATGELVGTFVCFEVGPEFIKAWFLGRPQQRRFHIEPYLTSFIPWARVTAFVAFGYLRLSLIKPDFQLARGLDRAGQVDLYSAGREGVVLIQ